MRKAILTAVVCVAASVLAFAADDLKITYRTETKAMMTSSKGTAVEYHSARYKLTKDAGAERDTLIDFGAFVTYLIDHKKKVVRRMALEDLQKATELIAAKRKDKKDGGEKTEVVVKKVGAEKIAGRTCEKWEITAGKASCKASADPSLLPPVDPDALKKAATMLNGGSLAMLGNDLGKFFEAMQSIKGIQLKSEQVIPAGPITARSFKEATEVVVGPVPASLFELPKGYQEEDTGKKLLADLEKSLK